MIHARIVADPQNEPLSMDECYLHLNLTEFDSNGRPDDAIIRAYAAAAREYCENWTGLSLAMKDYEVVLDAFTDSIELPYAPFITLLGGIVISDEISDNAIDETLYRVDDYTGALAVIYPTGSWPELATGNKVRIRFRAGFGDESEAAGPLPAPIKAAMLLMLGHLFEHRESVNVGNIITEFPFGVYSLLRPYRTQLGMA